MRSSECRAGMRVYFNNSIGGEVHGIVQRVTTSGTVANPVRHIIVLWDGADFPVEADPADLRREIPPPIGKGIDALERWLRG